MKDNILKQIKILSLEKKKNQNLWASQDSLKEASNVIYFISVYLGVFLSQQFNCDLN